jgi:RHS repeat-associated protein
VTVSDKKLAVDSDGNGVVDYYNADVITANDYYPFGSQMPGRNFAQANNSYRYGFNGKEEDNSTGEGNLDFGARIYDGRIGRFLSVDPKVMKYPSISPYCYADNSPILYVDYNGEGKIKYYLLSIDADGNAKLTLYKVVDHWYLPTSTSVEAPSLGLTYTFTSFGQGIKTRACAGCGSGNFIGEFEDFEKDPIAAIESGEYVTDAAIMDEAAKELAITLILGRLLKTSGSQSKIKTGKGTPQWLINVRRGVAFEQGKIKELIKNKINFRAKIRLVPKNGKGNVEGNRTDADALIKNADGTFSIKEYKLTDETALSKGQKASKENIDSGNKQFEVRSDIPEWGVKKGDVIKVGKYEVETGNK